MTAATLALGLIEEVAGIAAEAAAGKIEERAALQKIEAAANRWRLASASLEATLAENDRRADEALRARFPAGSSAPASGAAPGSEGPARPADG